MISIYKKNFILITMLGAFLACLLPLYLIEKYSETHLKLTLFISGLVLLLFCMKREPHDFLKGQYFKISNLFLLGFCIVHFQFYIDLSLSYASLDSILVINPDVINKSATISAIALCCFFIGYISKIRSARVQKKKTKEIFEVDLFWLRFFLVILFLGVILSTPWKYFTAGYIAVERIELALIIDKLFQTVSVGYLILNTRNLVISNVSVQSVLSFIKNTGFLISIILLVYGFLVLMSGDRGPIIKLVLAYVGCYFFKTRRKYNLAIILFLIFSAATTISLLAHVRHLDNISSPVEAIFKAIDRQGDFNKAQTILSGSSELARSIRTLHAAVEYTEINGYEMGYYKINGFLSLVPGLGRLVQPVIGVEKDAKSTNLLTTHLAADHGMGTSVIADIFLDFGIVGTVIVFIVLGWLLRILDVKSYSHLPLNIFSYVLVAVFLTSSIYIGRGSILDVFSDVIFTYIIILFVIFLNKIVPTKSKNNPDMLKNIRKEHE